MRWHSLTHDSERGWWCRTRLSIDSLFFGVVLPFFVSVENVFLFSHPQHFFFFLANRFFHVYESEQTNEREGEKDNEVTSKAKKNCYQLENSALVVCETFITMGGRRASARIVERYKVWSNFSNACVGADRRRWWCERPSFWRAWKSHSESERVLHIEEPPNMASK